MINCSSAVHQYYLFSTGTSLKGKAYDTRLEAEIAMHRYCAKHNISVECVEYDKHWRLYVQAGNNKKELAKFYINRI